MFWLTMCGLYHLIVLASFETLVKAVSYVQLTAGILNLMKGQHKPSPSELWALKNTDAKYSLYFEK